MYQDDFWYGTELYKAQALIIECCIKLNLSSYYNRISVEWSNGLKTTMGNARTRTAKDGGLRGEIRLSSALWPRASEMERRETTIHEAAHILAHIVYGERCGHGREWLNVMARLGYPNATRCHKVDTSGLKRKVKRYVVPCRNCDRRVTFKIEERNRAIQGVSYRCRCHSVFSIEEVENATFEEI